MWGLGCELRRVANLHQHAIYTSAQETALPDLLKHLGVRAGSIAHQGSEDVELAAFLLGKRGADNLGKRVFADFRAAIRTVRNAEPGEEQPQVIVNFCDRRQRGARPGSRRVLRYAQGRRQPFDQIDIRTFETFESTTSPGQCIEKPAASFGADRIECEGTLARAAHTREDGEPATRHVEVQTVQVMRARPADADRFCRTRHPFSLTAPKERASLTWRPGSPARPCPLAGPP